ncbi:peptide-methionine (R)-S-oxide reductase MsrB [Salegentibacter sediminis]|uniref:peptide-methionine (R)-S-oxide reductase MsrB n=1 Tax=Salegentibacter sediminis TaxID=1930251 RepID=UPI0009C18386|nr:peptide-methionine (R)-S-oxide reductase MsrB [Salegentibacter sediminis]
MKKLLVFIVPLMLFSCNGNAQKKDKTSQEYEITKTEAQWKAELSEGQYRILRKGETERAFTSPLNDIKEPGTFVCAACGNPLYKTKYKFDSGTGWPSFDRPIEDAVSYGRKTSYGYEDNEVHCARCGGHLGHVFKDGPRKTTGKRHCINGLAMEFVPEGK